MVYKHGRSGTPEHLAWVNIKRRCCNPHNKSYHNYGGRGIQICAQWRDDFEAFLADVGPRPTPEHQLDRIDVDGHYEPGNCRWVLPIVQCNNKRNNRRITYEGRTQTLAEWARELGLKTTTLWRRIEKCKLPLSRALSPEKYAGVERLVHGSRNTYEKHRCRCLECRAAHAARHRERRRRRAVQEARA